MAVCLKHLRAYHSLCIDCIQEAYPDVKEKITMVNDNVNNPAHYNKGSIECIDALAVVCEDLRGMEAVCTANAIKYLWRWKHKNGVEDLKKAKWYIERLINGIDNK